MNFMKTTRIIFDTARQHLHDHKCLWALVFPLAGVGEYTYSIIQYV